MIKDAIVKLRDRKNLTFEESRACVDEIMSGQTSQVQTTAFLTALAMKGETIDEITGCATGMRAHSVKLHHDFPVLEIVGTGGDRAYSFNISTTSAFVIAAAGIKVAKHGNRATSSKSGAADVLEALGIDITIPAEKSEQLLRDINICFLFAQNYHTSMKYVGPIRKELGIVTVFNILGPLTNPASASMQIMGVYREDMVEPMAQVLSNLGVERGMVVYGQDCLDEISVSSPTTVCEIDHGRMTSYIITPEQFGLTRCRKEDLVGGSPDENAMITKEILEGKKGPKRDAVLLNAGAAIYIAGKAENMEEGVEMAARLIDSGAAAKVLEKFIEGSKSAA